MKRKLSLVLIVIVVLLCSCSSSLNKEEGYIDLAEKYEENMEEAMEYYGRIYEGYTDYGLKKNLFSKDKIYFGNQSIDYVNYIYINYMGDKFALAIECESSKVAKSNYDEVITKSSDIGVYSIKNNVIFLDEAGSSVLLNGTPKHKKGIYYDALENDVIIMSEANIGTEHIFENISKIAAYALFNTSLEKIEFRKQLKYIGARAFEWNQNLCEVRLNEGLELIGRGAFSECPKLKYVVIPSTVISIGSGAFECEALYCNVERRPLGWKRDFASINTKVYWKGEWEYKNGIPTPINS